MKNTLGTSVAVTLFGESRGPAVGAVVDGLAPGLAVDEEEIARRLARRRPVAGLDTPRREPDRFQILSGVHRGVTTGAPLCIVIPNEDARGGEENGGLARPSHADYAAHCKYHGFEDRRGGGHFSGRVTAALAAVSGILLPALARQGITVGTHVLRCGPASDRPFEDTEKDVALLNGRAFPVLDPDAGERITREILAAREDGDSVGGVTQTAVCGLPAGVGEPWFDSVEGTLARALFGIGGIEGIEFGKGFSFAELRGSEANDPLRIRDGRIVTGTNHNGGVNGGIANGMPVVFQCAVKPTPTIAKEQRTVDLLTGREGTISARGRNDAAIVRRICPVVDAVTAVVLCDLLALRYGTDALRKGFGPCGTD